jgi:hypothetical protein
MIKGNLARLRTHRNSVHCYRPLLETSLTDLKCQFIEKRLSEEQSAVDRLAATTFPLALKLPHTSAQDSREAATGNCTTRLRQIVAVFWKDALHALVSS